MEIKDNTTLLIHHFDSMFNEGLKKFGTDLESMGEQLSDFMIENKDKINKIILTTFEDFELNDPEQHIIKNLSERLSIPFEHITYGYGWSRDISDGDCENYPESERDIGWIQATREYSSDDDVLQIEDWHHDLNGKNVTITGAFVGECLKDAETVLEFCGADVQYYNSLCVGSGQSYEMKYHLQEGNFYNKMQELEDYFQENDIESFDDVITLIEDMDGDKTIVDEIKDIFENFDTDFNNSKDPFKDDYDFYDFDFKNNMNLELGSMSQEFKTFLIENNIEKKENLTIESLLQSKSEKIKELEIEAPRLKSSAIKLAF